MLIFLWTVFDLVICLIDDKIPRDPAIIKKLYEEFEEDPDKFAKDAKKCGMFTFYLFIYFTNFNNFNYFYTHGFFLWASVGIFYLEKSNKSNIKWMWIVVP